MAKKKDVDFDKYASGMFLRQEQYAFKVRQFYERAEEQLLRLAKQHPEVAESAFTFAQSSTVEAEAARIIRELYANIYKQIREGVEAEWEYANQSADALIASAFANKRIKGQDAAARWFERDRQAMDTFIHRAEGGMNLSGRVWKLADNLRSEMETAIAVAIGQGLSADQMSREVRKYLQRPDMLFRRVRGKDGKLHLSKRAKEWTGKLGRGVYRSSYKNAMRVARTETNMAYRTADQQRWDNLDFVIGYQVRLSNTHGDGEEEAKDDMCDLLQGDYPKWFKWTGWHPQCKCSCIPILCTLDEMNAITDAILAGKDPSTVTLQGVINDVPDGFTKWIEDNSERILRAKSVPYFIRDNFRDGDITKGLLRAKRGNKVDKVKEQTEQTRSKSPISKKNNSVLQAAAQRHAQRTPERVEEIKQEWRARRFYIYADRNAELINSLTYCDGWAKYPALDKRWEAVTEAIKQDRSVKTVEKLMARFERGVATQQKWDKLVWDGFTKEQYQSLRKLEHATGVRKGRPMTHEQADLGNVNPHYKPTEWTRNSQGEWIKKPEWVKRYRQFSINCQTCASVYQLRRWGFNIEAKGNTGTNAFKHLSLNYSDAWSNIAIKKTTSVRDLWQNLKNGEDGIYQVKCVWKGGKSGHTFNFIKERERAYFYDPQTNKVYGSLDAFKAYSDNVSPKFGYEYFRIDDKIPNIKSIKDLIQNRNVETIIENAPKASQVSGTTGTFFQEIKKAKSNREEVRLIREFISDKSNHFQKVKRYSTKDNTIFSTIRDQYDKAFKEGEMPKNLAMAKKLTKNGWNVYLMPNPNESTSFDFIVEKKGLLYSLEGKALNGKRSIDHLIDNGTQQARRVLIDIIGNKSTGYIGKEIKNGFENNQSLSELWLLKGERLIKISRMDTESKTFKKTFRKIWEQ